MIADTRLDAILAIDFPFNDAPDLDLFQADGFRRVIHVIFFADL